MVTAAGYPMGLLGLGGFAPPSFGSRLYQWFRADLGVEQNDSDGFCSNWADFSGHSLHAAQPSLSNQFAIIPNAYGAMPVMRCNGPVALGGNDRHMTGTLDGSTFAAFTIYVIAKSSGST